MAEENIINLYDEDENEIKFEFIDYIEYENMNFVVLLPLEGDLENPEVIILQEVEDDETGDQYLDIIEDSKLLNTVYNIFKESHSEEFTFRD